MSKKMIIMVAVVILTLTATTVALAGRMKCLDCTVSGGGTRSDLLNAPKIEAGASGKVIITNMSDLVGAGDLTGLGKTDANVSLKATAVVQGITCTNNGQQLIEAQPRTIIIEAIELIRGDSINKNGRASFTVVNSEGQLIRLAPSLFCPNNNWTAKIDKLLWRGPAVLSASQPDQTLLVNFNCNQPDNVNQPFTCTTQ